VPFTDILDVMRDTGFIGIRLTQIPQILTKYNITAEQMKAEVNKRHLQVITVSFSSPPADKPEMHEETMKKAKDAMDYLKGFGANHLVVFSPRRGQTPETFEIACKFFNRLGAMANEMGFRAGLHNHMGQMVQTPEEIDRCMALTDPKLFWFSPDTAHVHLGGGDVPKILEKYKHRIMLADYKDAKRGDAGANFLQSIYDLGDGEIDFPACHRVLKSINFKGWLCVDLDIARQGIRKSYERCGAYVVNKLEPIYL
jgi:inosose dehydratase